MRNFDIIKDIDYLQNLHKYCSACEENQKPDPETSVIYGRKALEWLVTSIYEMLNLPADKCPTLYDKLSHPAIVQFVNDDMLMKAAHYIRKTGNLSAHNGKVSKGMAFFTLLNLYNFVGACLVKLRCISSFPQFNESLTPSTPMYVQPQAATCDEHREFVESVSEESVASAPQVKAATSLSEAETRRQYIDLMLAEAGWEVLSTNGAIQASKACVEVEVHGMPSDSGIGYADYVLFGANGKPLAVIEAKKTMNSPTEGKHQAELYASCLEAKYGVKPVIYYTNGFETQVIDGLGYPPRHIYAFHSQTDLQWLMQKREKVNNDQAGDGITPFLQIKDHITDRAYQKTAIKAVVEHFQKKHRRALLVMATGTGKTRTSISLVDVMMRQGDVKNVLFLADRNTLVKQAHKNFVKLLPDVPTCRLNEGERNSIDKNARIIFCTYQTMINYVDTDCKEFSVGRFDLIIIDEAHRSVFGKYGAIFSYFDGLLVGLTATPRDQIDKSTYDLFEVESGQPNYAYELEEAVQDGYLVNYKILKRDSDIIKNGIKYRDLSPAERDQLERVWIFEAAKNELDPQDAQPRDITSKEIYNYIFNTDTVDKVLQDLMNTGLKVQSGERIGKTIIFAYNHKHAELIVQRFYALFPEYGSQAGDSTDFCVVIDNYVKYGQDLIDNFELRDQNPQIAVSVDMLDTGVDVPDVLNLVFFKPVKSYIKFMQMIGRGTRLSPDIFGAGKHKEGFLIFDWCGVFDFFEMHPQEYGGKSTQSLTERLFCLRTQIAYHLQKSEFQEQPFAKQMHDELKALLKEQVNSLNDMHISVRKEWQTVSHFKTAETWQYLTLIDVQDLEEKIAPLLPKEKSEESAKKFDVLALCVELSLVNPEVTAAKSANKIVLVAQRLQDMTTLPQVRAKIGIIKEVCTPSFWENVTLDAMERVRVELRELVNCLFAGNHETFEVDIADTIAYGEEQDGIILSVTYKQKVLDYLREHRDLPVLQKIKNIEALSHSDILELERILWSELGTKEDYEKYTKNMICGDFVAAFIRSMVGVDRSLALRKFTDFISDHNLSAMQEEYLKTIITYVCENGDVTTETITNEPPFDNFDWLDTFGENLIYVRQFVDTLHNAIVG